MTDETVLTVSAVSKSFGATRALDRVDVDVRRSEIHALLGGNGSGKSTLVKILAGIHTADSGAIEAHAPLHIVHQDPAVFLDLSVADNLSLGRGFETDATGRIRWRSVRRRTMRTLSRFAIDARPETTVGELGPAARTMVAIARALQDVEKEHRGVLVLDEPTAALPAAEAERLLAALRRYVEAGQSMLFVSHRLDEVLGLAHRITVLRDGRRVATVGRRDVDHDGLVELITGRSRRQLYPDAAAHGEASPLLQVRDLVAGTAAGVDFEVGAGEVVGIAGLAGSGASDVLESVFGAAPRRGGTVLVAGEDLPRESPRAAIRLGLAYVPGERRRSAFADLDVRENLTAGAVDRYWNGVVIRKDRERRDAREAMARFGVEAASDAQPLATLSGGNQQKVVLGRRLHHRPRLLLLDEPTQGVDVGARAHLYLLIREAADAGTGVVLSTLDFDEIAGLCDRALVLANGRIVGELRRPLLDADRLTELAYRGAA